MGAHRQDSYISLKGETRKNRTFPEEEVMFELSLEELLRSYPGKLGLKMPVKEKETASSEVCNLFFL